MSWAINRKFYFPTYDADDDRDAALPGCVVGADVSQRRTFLLTGMMNAEVLQQLEKGFRHPQPEGCPNPLYDIMLDCWKQSSVTRPTFEYLKNTMEDFPVAVETQYVE